MSPSPPAAKRLPTAVARHTRTITDDWAWLRAKDDPDTLAYLEAENAYADAWIAPLQPLRDAIFDEIKRRTKETDLSVPARKGPWWYYSRTIEGLDYALHCRRATFDDTSPEHVLVDENLEAGDHDYFELGGFDVSPSGHLLLWSTDTTGAEELTLRIRDLRTGADLADRIERTTYGTAWSADERLVFYTVPDDAMRAFQVWRHEVGRADSSGDVLVFQEDDDRFSVGVEASRSDAMVFVVVGSRTTSEVWFVPAAAPTEPLTVIAPRQIGIEYEVDHQGDRFVILTNAGDSEDFTVVTAPVTDPGPERWTTLVAHVAGRRIDDAHAFATHLVLAEWFEARQRLRVLFADGTDRVISFDEDVHSVELGANAEYDTTNLRFTYQSLVTPPTVFDEDVVTGERVLRKRQQVLGGYDQDDYESFRTWAPADDGTLVPVDVVRRRGIATPSPLVVYGYGSYESSMPPWFSIARLSLLDRGAAWALAHTRGGGELGRQWYVHGRLAEKRNTFTDAIAVAEHLVATGVATRAGLALRGASAGGLLVGATINLRPDLFAAAVAQVPFVDVVNTMHDTSLPLTTSEYEEWGNPADPVVEAYLESYSPYENVSSARYPALLVTAGFNDPRVSYHEPAKWVAKLRATTDPASGPLLLWTELGAGHGGPSGRYDSWREEAKILAFVLQVLGCD